MRLFLQLERAIHVLFGFASGVRQCDEAMRQMEYAEMKRERVRP